MIHNLWIMRDIIAVWLRILNSKINWSYLWLILTLEISVNNPDLKIQNRVEWSESHHLMVRSIGGPTLEQIKGDNLTMTCHDTTFITISFLSSNSEIFIIQNINQMTIGIMLFHFFIKNIWNISCWLGWIVQKQAFVHDETICCWKIGWSWIIRKWNPRTRTRTSTRDHVR